MAPFLTTLKLDMVFCNYTNNYVGLDGDMLGISGSYHTFDYGPVFSRSFGEFIYLNCPSKKTAKLKPLEPLYLLNLST